MKTYFLRLAPLLAAALLAGCSESGVHAGGMPKDLPTEAPKPHPGITEKMAEAAKKGVRTRSLQAAKRLPSGPIGHPR
ncbi:MAG: hypothetical protein P4L84_11610 [Isosphaeraceae bacterium]|nr:hypothetical protein [Isosphaeraceae bacterium]